LVPRHCRSRRRLPDHQDRHQPLLRQDEGRRRPPRPPNWASSLKSYAGKIDGDHESQVAAIETCIADGAKGILITAVGHQGDRPSVKKARDAGLLVIALDTPLDPIDAADATFATDNFLAGLN
jgi:hypothetical protein